MGRSFNADARESVRMHPFNWHMMTISNWKRLFNNCRQCFALYNSGRFQPSASHATHGAGAMVLVNVMRIPCFGRRMTIGRASIVCPGAN